MALLNCQDGLTGQNIIDAINENTGKAEVSQIVALGASIINGTFSSDVSNLQNSVFYGLSGTPLDEQGVSGDDVSDLLLRLPAILTTYDGVENVVFVMHIGGNNVTDTRPYSAATLAELQGISTGINQIIGLIEAAGHKLFMASISYRYYDDGSASEEDGSLPYNQNIIEPIIKNRLPDSWDFVKNKPRFDMYNWTKDNPDLMSADGVHPTTLGYEVLCEWWYEQMAKVITPNAPTLYTTSSTKAIVDTGSLVNTATGIYLATDLVINDIGGTTLTGGGRVILNNFDGSSQTGGRGNLGDASVSLSNNELLTSYIFTNNSRTYINICNLESNKTGVITFTASRNSLDGTRLTDLTYNSVTKTLDPEVIPAETVEFDFDTGDNGVIQIQVAMGDGSINAYISGIELTFD